MWVLSHIIRDKEILANAQRWRGVKTPGFCHQNLQEKGDTRFLPSAFFTLMTPTILILINTRFFCQEQISVIQIKSPDSPVG